MHWLYTVFRLFSYVLVSGNIYSRRINWSHMHPLAYGTTDFDRYEIGDFLVPTRDNNESCLTSVRLTNLRKLIEVNNGLAQEQVLFSLRVVTGDIL